MEFDENIAKIAGLVALSLAFFVRSGFRNSRIILPRYFTVFFLGLVAISAHYFFVGSSQSEENNQIILAGFALLAACFWAGNSVQNIERMRPFQNILSIAAVAFLFSNAFFLVFSGADAFYEGNFIGITDNANMLGGYLAICCLPIFIQSALNHNRIISKIIFCFIILICIYLLFITRSRAAILAAGASISFVTIYTDKIGKYSKISIISFMAIAMAILVLQASGKYADASLFSTRDPLVYQRIEAISERPFLGWGFNSDVYSYYYLKNQFPAMEKGNTVLQLFEEYGIPFGIVISISIYWLFAKFAIELNKNKIGVAFAMTLVASLTHLLFETWLFNFQAILSIYIWGIVLMHCMIRNPSSIMLPQGKPA